MERVSLLSPAFWDMSSKLRLIVTMITTTYIVGCQVLKAFNSPNNLENKSYYNPFMREKEIEA